MSEKEPCSDYIEMEMRSIRYQLNVLDHKLDTVLILVQIIVDSRLPELLEATTSTRAHALAHELLSRIMAKGENSNSDEISQIKESIERIEHAIGSMANDAFDVNCEVKNSRMEQNDEDDRRIDDMLAEIARNTI